jgi:hypothetical protein
MLGQPSRDDVLNPGSVPGVASIETAVVHPPYAWASARETSATSPAWGVTGVTPVESQDTAARATARAMQADRIVVLVNILHLHER